MDAGSLSRPFRVADGRDFGLEDRDPGSTRGLSGKHEGRERLGALTARLGELQARLFAQGRHALLVIVQAMDAGGKDGTIAHVMAGVNPQGFRVSSFKVPTAAEARHDFLWRTTAELPGRGSIGIFNRSYYEEVLVTRVHPEFLGAQGVAADPDEAFWEARMESIRDHERHLARNGTAVLKIFLDVSRREQARRLLARVDDPLKHWKFDPGDLAERARWGDYRAAYEAAIRATATEDAPWFVVPADHKWFARLVVADAIVARLEALDLQLPQPTDAQKAAMDVARQALRREVEDTP